MLASVWPHWLRYISWLWTNPASYNLWSSSWGELILKMPLVVWAIRHLNCDVSGCKRLGHPVEGTGHRACRHHHPHMKSQGRVTERDIAYHHKESQK